MKSMRTLLAGLCILAMLPEAARATSSDWFEVDGARVRIATSGLPEKDGVLKGLLDIQLKPGWKTYWRDPGDAGVPPSVDVSKSTNVKSADLDFPVPQRHDDGDFTWAGYNMPVSLPIRFQIVDPTKDAVITADVFLGICEDICVPVQSVFTLDPAADPDNGDDRAAVAAAFDALPGAARPGFEVLQPVIEGDIATFEVEMPAGAKAVDLFVGAIEGYAFMTPKTIEKGGKTFFEVKATRPATPPAAGEIHYTLVGDSGSVSGTLKPF